VPPTGSHEEYQGSRAFKSVVKAVGWLARLPNVLGARNKVWKLEIEKTPSKKAPGPALQGTLRELMPRRAPELVRSFETTME
jgi:hypothetical protein